MIFKFLSVFGESGFTGPAEAHWQGAVRPAIAVTVWYIADRFFIRVSYGISDGTKFPPEMQGTESSAPQWT